MVHRLQQPTPSKFSVTSFSTLAKNAVQRIQKIYGGIIQGPSLAYSLHRLGHSTCEEVNKTSIDPIPLEDCSSIRDMLDNKQQRKYFPFSALDELGSQPSIADQRL